MVTFNFYFCHMKMRALLLFSFVSISYLHAQDTSVVTLADTVSKNLFEFFQWKEKSKGEFEITVQGYDSLKKGNNDFQIFYYTTKDKPDGKLSVRDEKGN